MQGALTAVLDPVDIAARNKRNVTIGQVEQLLMAVRTYDADSGLTRNAIVQLLSVWVRMRFADCPRFQLQHLYC